MDDNISRRPGKGSLADLVSVSDPSSVGNSLSAETWIKVAVLGALFVIVNFWFDGFWQWKILWRNWIHEDDWQHGLVIPLFSLYLIYSRRNELLAATRKGSFWGLPIIIGSLLMITVGFYPVGVYFVSHVGMVFLLLGLVLYLAGPSAMRVAWVPIVYLALAMPISDSLYGAIAMPLQLLAAKTSGGLLHLFGVTVDVDALNLQITSGAGKVYPVEVAEACSGVRSLMAFVALSVAWAYINDRPWWHRVVLILAGLPIMVACNILRVTLTGAMFAHDWPELGNGTMHEMMGMILLIPALGLLWLLSRLMQALFVDVEEPSDSPPDAGATPGGVRP